ncbi:carbohydrate kinase [Stenotrophomonas sp. MMGLT7]|uniref:carbohydrate kinase family protein n=1 Tax=Stenotrophomonas sp. MMGLT7 TaxID=2901227 RepID=UPI001E2FBF61|nr:carbohydrate kinase [Stenotrophomonas sp. MMGLT7]MCD7098374.1 carbohydrate kinase [Stenotrophomonas sp. MMGLT7]
MAAPRTTVACFGEALIDFLSLPAAAGQPRSFLEQPGGAPANVAVGVAQLGGRSRFVGMLAQDIFGDTLLAALRAHAVDTAQVRRTDAAPTALAFVSLDAAGERSFSFYRPPAADLLFRSSDFDETAFADIAVFHVCSNSLTHPDIAEATLHGMRLAAAAGALVSIDLNLRPALWPRDADPRPWLWRALALAKLVKLSREELEALTDAGDTAAVIERLLAGDAEAVVVTDGAAPIHWWTRSRHGQATTFPVDTIDTTAAGDAFVAGLLWRLVALGIGAGTLAAAFDDDAVRADLLRHGAAAGALATTRHGAFVAMPDADAVRTLIETHG